MLSAPSRDAINGVINVDSAVDRESPAGGGEAVVVRPSLLPYGFYGPGDAHWIGQPCGVLQCGTDDPDFPLVVLACGCRARVPWSTFRVRHKEGPPEYSLLNTYAGVGAGAMPLPWVWHGVMRVVIADDHPLFRDVLCSLLRQGDRRLQRTAIERPR